MATSNIAPNDDNYNEGTTDTPAQDDASINITDPQQSSGGGQKETKKDSRNDPLSTSRRRWNPLSKLSSYTYNITLYMLTPECANFVANKGKLPSSNAEGRYFIVAQSGGINSDEEARALTIDSTLGPGEPGLDFYIDDLNIKVYMLSQDNQKTATAATTFTFKIIEPTGFTFLTKLSKACQQINKISNLISTGDASALPNLYQQHYLLGIRFYGYDVNGELIKSSDVPDGGESFNGDQYAIYERFFPIISSKVSTRITGRATEYSFEGQYQNLQAAFGRKRGTIPANAEFKGGTVGEIIGNVDTKNTDSLIAWLNNNQEKEEKDKKRKIVQTFDVQWLETDAIKNSSLLVDSDYSKEISPMSIAKSVKQVNANTSVKSTSINTKQVIKGFSPDTPIVMAMDQIIVKSDYVVNTLIKKVNDNIEADTDAESKGLLQWYAIHPVTEILGRDEITKDWAYKTTYQIKQYPIPYLRSQYAPARSKYYGPVKQYSYFLTGENTEVISFEMSYDNSFYVITSPSTSKDDSAAKSKTSSPVQTAGGTVSAPGSGQLNAGNSIVENVRANLYSPADQAIVNIKILGDPDFLMDTIGHKIQSDTFSKFYGKNDAVNPYGGQVFIEIIFRIAEDYRDDGLLDVDANEMILFYPPEIQSKLGNRGMIYLINSVDSSFSRGKFEQSLELRMINPADLILPENQTDAETARLNRSGNRPGNSPEPDNPEVSLDGVNENVYSPDAREPDVNTENLDPNDYVDDTDDKSISTPDFDSGIDPLIYTSNPDDDASVPYTEDILDFDEEDVREEIDRQSPVTERISDADAIRDVEESILQPPPGY